jgi:hypothetical protein
MRDILLLILVGTTISAITAGMCGLSLITIVPIVDMFGIVTIGTWIVLEIHELRKKFSGWEYIDEMEEIK